MADISPFAKRLSGASATAVVGTALGLKKTRHTMYAPAGAQLCCLAVALHRQPLFVVVIIHLWRPYTASNSNQLTENGPSVIHTKKFA